MECQVGMRVRCFNDCEVLLIADDEYVAIEELRFYVNDAKKR